MKAFLEYIPPSQKDIWIKIGGSKSISNRLLVLQAQFPNIQIANVSTSDDTLVLAQGLREKSGTVDVGQAGTAMRFLTAYFASEEGRNIVLTGSARMRKRPIAPLVDALRHLGAEIDYLKEDGFPPLQIRGRRIAGGKVTISASVSSQFVTALMLIAPKLPMGMEIALEGEVVSAPYLSMTLQLLKDLGIEAGFKRNRIAISPVSEIKPKKITVESDWSSASYIFSLVALSPDAQVNLSYFSRHSLQGDSALPAIFENLGVSINFNDSAESILIEKNNTALSQKFHMDLANTPDLAQTLAVSCFALGIPCRLSGLQTLKIKETDRLVALKTELEKLGAEVQIDAQSITVNRQTEIRSGQEIATYGDHRMAMAFAPLAAVTSLAIENPQVVSKSYPHFWKDFEKMGIKPSFK